MGEGRVAVGDSVLGYRECWGGERWCGNGLDCITPSRELDHD